MLAGISVGFAAAAREALLADQEAIRAALLGERMRLEGAVRESEASLAAAQRIAHLGSFDWDLQGETAFWSDELFRLLGWQPGEVTTNLEGWFKSVHPDDLHLVKKSVEDGFAGKFYPYEFRTAGRDGVVRTLSARFEVISDNTGRPIRVFGTALDITDLKRSEEARREAEAEAAALRQLDNLKDELLSTISHELRTPLAVIRGYAQRLAMRAPTMSSETLQATIKSIESSSAQLALLVEDLLDFSRMQRGDVQVQLEDFDLVPKLQELVIGIRQRPDGERLTCELPSGLPVRGDPARVGQIVINLVENALKYAPGGPVVLRGRRVSNSAAADVTDTAAAMARVEVVDSGPGIPLKEQPRVWEKFYRGSSVAGLSRARGSGIGLAVVKALVVAQGGRVGLESTPGQGATFWFELPVAGADPSSA
jgi:PAS domain S-box-containing protein